MIFKAQQTNKQTSKLASGAAFNPKFLLRKDQQKKRQPMGQCICKPPIW